MQRIVNIDLNSDYITQLEDAICKKMIVIFGSCTAIFDGRIKSFLPQGTRLLIIKKDETLILHGSYGVKPLNWQKPGAGKINFLKDKSNLIVKTFRPKTKETLEIIFSELFQIALFEDQGEAKLRIYGSESDLSDYLFEHPEIISDDFQPTKREYETPFGFIDLRGVDRDGNIIIVEVKKRKANLNDAHQLKRYVEYFEDVEKITVKGILVAKGFSTRVTTLLQQNDLKGVAIQWEEIFPTLSNDKFDQTLDNFLQEKKTN